MLPDNTIEPQKLVKAWILEYSEKNLFQLNSDLIILRGKEEIARRNSQPMDTIDSLKLVALETIKEKKLYKR